MKKLTSIILALVMLLSATAVFAAKDVSVEFNGKAMDFDVNPIIENGRTLVPFRAIFESLGCAVFYFEYDGKQVVTASKADQSLILTIGENKMYFEDREITLDVAPKILNDRTLVPLRAVSEAFDAQVQWNDETKTASVATKQGDHNISAKNVSKEILAQDGTKLANLVAVYPVIDNPENSEFINTINELSFEFVSDAVFGDDELEEKLQAFYTENKTAFLAEISSTFTVDTDKNGIISFTNHVCYSTPLDIKNFKESIVWDMKGEKQMELTDILIGDLEEEINQTVYDAFVAYYEENYTDEFDAKAAERLGKELGNVRFSLTDDSLLLRFNPGQVLDNAVTQTVEIPYSKAFFKITLDALEGKVISPLPSAIDLKNLKDCTVSVSFDKGDAYVDDDGQMQLKAEIFDYDVYDMVDIAGLKVGDTIIRFGEKVKVTSVENKNGTVFVNGGMENDGFDLVSDESTVYYETTYNDAKQYYSVGEALIPVSADFKYIDESDLEGEPVEFYPGDFLTDYEKLEYDFSPNNTALIISEGYAIELHKYYTP